MGGAARAHQNGGPKGLNTSVLNKMPNDCTAANDSLMYSLRM